MRRSLSILAAALLAVSCSSSTGHASASTHASPSAATTPTVTIVSPSPTPTGSAADLPLTKVSFSCRLPVSTLTYGPESMTYQGGFINFPAGTYAADPNGIISFKGGLFVTTQTPVLTGGSTPPFFDAAARRWVPSGPGQAAPDGRSYAYATSPSTGNGGAVITVVDVVRGTQKSYPIAIPLGAGTQGIEVMDYDGAGVDFVVDLPENLPGGVWRLNVADGNVTRLADVDNVMAVRDGFAWAGAVDPHDPTPPKAGAIGTLYDTIDQVNLTTRVVTNWYYTQGRSDLVIGVASGDRPIVLVAPPDFASDVAEVRIIDHPNTSAEDNGESVAPPGFGVGNPQADGDRTWFAGPGGIYLYTSADGLQRVFAGGSDPKAAGGQISPAGICA